MRSMLLFQTCLLIRTGSLIQNQEHIPCDEVAACCATNISWRRETVSLKPFVKASRLSVSFKRLV